VAEGEIRHRLALDIGGTFTDLAAVNVATGELSSKDRRVA
jgi:N-methylhydantoinase A/oxoprolinase/acetone carboxylase beta subunit